MFNLTTSPRHYAKDLAGTGYKHPNKSFSDDIWAIIDNLKESIRANDEQRIALDRGVEAEALAFLSDTDGSFYEKNFKRTREEYLSKVLLDLLITLFYHDVDISVAFFALIGHIKEGKR